MAPAFMVVCVLVPEYTGRFTWMVKQLQHACRLPVTGMQPSRFQLKPVDGNEDCRSNSHLVDGNDMTCLGCRNSARDCKQFDQVTICLVDQERERLEELTSPDP